MGGHRSVVVVAVLAVPLLVASADPAFAQEGLPGKIVLSDGTVLEGEILTRGDLPIRLYGLKSKRFRRVHLSEMARLSVRVTKAEQVKEFEWVEMGSDEKIFTGKTYPRKDFEGDIELLSGEKISGHLLGVVYVRLGEDIRKFELTRYQRGKTGKKLEDLVHVKEIVFPGAKKRASCTVRLKLENGGPKPRVFVLGTASPVFRDAEREEKTGDWEVSNLAPGTYDFVVVTKKKLALGLSAPVQAKGGGKITAEAEKLIRERVAEVRNFFTDKKPVLVNGTDRAARALVRMVRTEKSTFDGKKGRHRFFRFEIWTLVKVGERWIVDSRTFVTRGKDPIESETLSEPKVKRVKALEGLAVGAEKTEAVAVLDLKPKKKDR